MDKINERALKVVYNDISNLSIDELLVKINQWAFIKETFSYFPLKLPFKVKNWIAPELENNIFQFVKTL